MIRLVVAFILAVAVSAGEGPKILDITISPPNPRSFSAVFATARIHSPSGKPSHLDWKLLYHGDDDEGDRVDKIYKLTKLSENEYKSGASINVGRIRPGHSFYLEVKNDFGSDTKEVKLHVGVGYLEECDDSSNGTAVCEDKNQECRLWLCRCREGYAVGVNRKSCYPEARYGEHCNPTLTCVDGTKCNRKVEKCLCPHGYYWDSFYSYCRTGAGYMDQCDNSSTIKPACVGDNIECRDWKCRCREGYEVGVAGKSCYPVAGFGEHCNSTIGCVNTTECNKKEEQCLCRQGYYWDSFYSSCRAGVVPKIQEFTISPPGMPLNGTEVFATVRFHSGEPFQHDWKLLYDGEDEGIIGVKTYWPTKLSENEYNASASLGPVRAGSSISFEVSNEFGSDKKEVKIRVGVGYMSPCIDNSKSMAWCVGENIQCRDWKCRCREGYEVGVDGKNCYSEGNRKYRYSSVTN